MILLDTTVLVYSKGIDHPLRDPCRELLTAVAEGAIRATTTVESIQEFVHVRARRRDRAEAVALGLDYAALLTPLLAPNEADLREGLALFESRPQLGAFDAVLAATGMSAGATAVVSADGGFAELGGLDHIVPDRAGVDALLGR